VYFYLPLETTIFTESKKYLPEQNRQHDIDTLRHRNSLFGRVWPRRLRKRETGGIESEGDLRGGSGWSRPRIDDSENIGFTLIHWFLTFILMSPSCVNSVEFVILDAHGEFLNVANSVSRTPFCVNQVTFAI